MPELPVFINPNLPECRRLTRVLATLPDSQLFCVWNSRTKRYEVWGPSQNYGVYPVTAVEDPQGAPCNPDLYPMYILADLRRRDVDPNMRSVMEHNAQLAEKAWQAEMDTMGDYAQYVAKAVAQEVGGAVRYGAADVYLGLRNAMHGTSRGAPIGRRFYGPGMRGSA
jgi:hypothetical protein